MARLPMPTREQLNDEDREYFDEITGRRGGIRGPFGALLHSPQLAARVAATGHYVRFDFDCPDALKEVVILAAMREINCQVEFTSHARLARRAGVSEDNIRAIARGTAPQGLSGDEEILVRYAQELIRDHRISDGTFGAVRDRFGVRGTVDLTGLIGHFLLIGLFLAAFEVDLEPSTTPELPE